MKFTKTNDLERSTPEAQGIASSAIWEFVQVLDEKIDEVHSFMLLRHGAVVAEGWWEPCAAEYPHYLASLAKSVSSTAVGLAIQEGYFSLEDHVISFFPDEVPDAISDNLKAMTVRHLLTMSSGHTRDALQYMGNNRPDGQWMKGFFAAPVEEVPGTRYVYNTGASYMLSAIVQKTTGMKMIDYLKPRIFELLGIGIRSGQESPEGINTGGFGLEATTEDIARFGQFYLQKGMWQGKRILSEAWIEAATSFQIANGDNPNSDSSQGYGYHMPLCRHGAYRASGAFGQLCLVMPEQDAVLALTGGMSDTQPVMDAVWEILLPAMADDALEEDNQVSRALAEKLSHLAFPTIEGQQDSPFAAEISAQTFQLEENQWHIDTIQFDFSGASLKIRFKTPETETTLVCGYGEWLRTDPTTLLNRAYDVDATPFATSGAWTDEQCFSIITRLYMRPFYHTFHFHFEDHKLHIETRVNVAFSIPETQIIRGYAI